MRTLMTCTTTMMMLGATMLSAQTPATTDTGDTATLRARYCDAANAAAKDDPKIVPPSSQPSR